MKNADQYTLADHFRALADGLSVRGGFPAALQRHGIADAAAPGAARETLAVVGVVEAQVRADRTGFHAPVVQARREQLLDAASAIVPRQLLNRST